MDCPRCRPSDAREGPYRDGADHTRKRPHLSEMSHSAGITPEVCPTCGGMWLEHGALDRLQNVVRGRRRSVSIAGMLQRAYAQGRQKGVGADAPTRPVACPKCGEDLFEREWGIGTLVFVDVCVGCRGVWLDPGELDALEEAFSSSG